MPSAPDGGWLKSHSIPSDRGSYGSFNVLQDENRKVILEVLEGQDEKPSKDDTPAEAAEKANLLKLRTGYRTCMDEVRRLFKQRVGPLNFAESNVFHPTACH
jgi:predicted metalloendopeptidase